MHNFNILNSTDSYKVSHYQQFPVNVIGISYYIEPRSDGKIVKAAGFNNLARMLNTKITVEQVEKANARYLKHFGKNIFNLDGWLAIADLGYLPLKLMAVPEGTVMPTHLTMAVVESTDQRFPWLPGWVETTSLRAVWYATSVCTKSWECKNVISKYLSLTSDLEGEEFDSCLSTRLHDFGARGSSSSESASIAGLAHLYNFVGTDTVEALILAEELFGVECAGYSIAAREHSTTIIYRNEDDAYLNSISVYGDGAYACVMDSTDYKSAVRRVCNTMRIKIIEAGGTFVFRPDSGNMFDNISWTLDILAKKFGYTINSKGYKVLSKHCRIIQGDEIESFADIEKVLSMMTRNGYSTENIAFGMGGGLHQRVNRDNYKFAMKLSSVTEMNLDTSEITHRGVQKKPKDALWKESKMGKRRLLKNGDQFIDVELDDSNKPEYTHFTSAMKTYYYNGVVFPDTLEEIRSR